VVTRIVEAPAGGAANTSSARNARTRAHVASRLMWVMLTHPPSAVIGSRRGGESRTCTDPGDSWTRAAAARGQTLETQRSPTGPCSRRSLPSNAFSSAHRVPHRRYRELTYSAVAFHGGCCTKGSKKLRNLSSGRRIANRSSGEGLVPFVCDFRALSAWVVPSQIDAPDPRVVCATASMPNSDDAPGGPTCRAACAFAWEERSARRRAACCSFCLNAGAVTGRPWRSSAYAPILTAIGRSKRRADALRPGFIAAGDSVWRQRDDNARVRTFSTPSRAARFARRRRRAAGARKRPSSLGAHRSQCPRAQTPRPPGTAAGGAPTMLRGRCRCRVVNAAQAPRRSARRTRTGRRARRSAPRGAGPSGDMAVTVWRTHASTEQPGTGQPSSRTRSAPTRCPRIRREPSGPYLPEEQGPRPTHGTGTRRVHPRGAGGQHRAMSPSDLWLATAHLRPTVPLISVPPSPPKE
jgi:hypothetical protein